MLSPVSRLGSSPSDTHTKTTYDVAASMCFSLSRGGWSERRRFAFLERLGRDEATNRRRSDAQLGRRDASPERLEAARAVGGRGRGRRRLATAEAARRAAPSLRQRPTRRGTEGTRHEPPFHHHFSRDDVAGCARRALPRFWICENLERYFPRHRPLSWQSRWLAPSSLEFHHGSCSFLHEQNFKHLSTAFLC